MQIELRRGGRKRNRLNDDARQRQLFEAFGPMNTRMRRIWDSYADDELDLIADFLTRTVAAGRASADEIG